MTINYINTSKLDKSLRRERKKQNSKNGMRRDGDSVKVIQRIQKKRRDEIWNKRRKEKEAVLESLGG